ncbi:MAG: DUF262 domain-containing protein [Brachymonas sp.]|nr:DUF262 domain-containing protein [Brachymonas sp.]
MTLASEIDQRRREIRTDGYSMSIGEWVSLYEKDELDIHPEFQRFYRWSDTQKTNLIESILLGIPLPPIFVNQRKDGVWDVVDGLQRLSTIFQLLGILKDEKNKLVNPLVLQSTKYLPSLLGMQWNDPKTPSNSLSNEMQLTIKRSKLAVSIILKESDVNAKYDLFQRLNTGGSELSPQEVRNCLLLMLNKKMYEWLKSLSQYSAFRNTISLSDRTLEEAYDIELALRFIILFNIDENGLQGLGDIGVFVTDRMTEMANNKRFPYKKVEETFKQTFDMLEQMCGEDSFKRYNKTKKKHEGGFLLSQFEVVGMGLGHNIQNGTSIVKTSITKTIMSIWSDTRFTEWSRSGVNASSRVRRLVPLGRTLFKK